MSPSRLLPSAVGPLRLFTTVGSPPPFALSLSKGQAELDEAVARSLKASTGSARTVMREGFDKLSPNGSLRTLKFAFGATAELRFPQRTSRQVRWSH